MLFHGPPGLGKTTLAGILAREMGVGFRATSGPVIAMGSDIDGVPMTSQKPGIPWHEPLVAGAAEISHRMGWYAA